MLYICLKAHLCLYSTYISKFTEKPEKVNFETNSVFQKFKFYEVSCHFKLKCKFDLSGNTLICNPFLRSFCNH